MARYRGELKIIALALFAVVCFAVLLASREETTAAGVWNQIAHGENDTGAQTNWGVNLPNELTDTGVCRNCHLQHAYLNGVDTPNTGTGYYFGLPLSTTASPYINSTCFRCHTDTKTIQPGWPGKTVYEASAHWTSASVVWPASGYTAGTCRNCHDPHGLPISATANQRTGGPYTATTQPVPNLLREQEEFLCYNCHDATAAYGGGAVGPAATGIYDEFTKDAARNAAGQFGVHPINRNTAANDRTTWWHLRATDTFDWGGNRHVECTDCHNPHAAKAGLHTNEDSKAGNVLLGAYGAAITYAPLTYTAVQQTAARTNYEYEICMRCHSGYTTGLPANNAPDRLTNVAADFNPAQRAIHPVMGRGKLTADTTLVAGVWVNGWDTRSYVTCSDCHYVHGQPTGDYAQFQDAMLRTSNPAGAAAIDIDHVVCYLCHNFDVYSASGTNQAWSRASHPVAASHDDNAANAYGVWCMNCHGGAQNGGMHGTDSGVGTSGATALGDHFMNGAAMAGFTYNAGGGKFECWTRATNAYNLTCTQHAGGKQASYNFNYNP